MGQQKASILWRKKKEKKKVNIYNFILPKNQAENGLLQKALQGTKMSHSQLKIAQVPATSRAVSTLGGQAQLTGWLFAEIQSINSTASQSLQKIRG